MKRSFAYSTAILSACATLLVLAWILKFCAYGFDFSNEGFYLVWLSDPFAYDYAYSITHFGFVYHPIFLLIAFTLLWLSEIAISCSAQKRKIDKNFVITNIDE